MSGYQITALGQVRVMLDDFPGWDQALADCYDDVEINWRREQDKRGPALFNGRLANMIGWQLDSFRGNQTINLRVHFIEYKAFLAKRINPKLPLPVQPVGVCGLCVGYIDDSPAVLMARRAEDVTQYPGYWEMVPSGTLDESCTGEDGTIDCARKITEEFTEETGLPASCVQACRSVALICDTQENNYDVCFIFQVDSGYAMKTRQRAILSREYVEPMWVPVAEIDSKLKSLGGRVVPVSAGLLEAWRRIGGICNGLGSNLGDM